jgi:SAM-dependent methyltransferase
VSGTDFSTVTELPGNKASAEQLTMIHTRYRFAYDYCRDKDVLEAACGPGRGLGYLAGVARSVIGGDFTVELVEKAKEHYGDRIKIVRMDAQDMPFADASFDVVMLFEALYYLPRVSAFLSEARRVLRRGGTLLLCMPNPEWADFNRSPFSHKYYSAREVKALLEDAGFEAQVKASFPVEDSTAGGRTVSAIRRAAVALGLVPKTMKGKALLKRIFYGNLTELGPEIDVSRPLSEIVPVSSGRVTGYKVLYAVGRLR